MTPPQTVGEELGLLMQRNGRRSLKLAAETARLQQLLAARVFPLSCSRVWLSNGLLIRRSPTKQTRDIDLLVPPEFAEAALQIIERESYALSLPAKKLSKMQRRALIRYGREVELLDARRRLRVELQWRAADNPLLLGGITAHSPTQSVTLSERQLLFVPYRRTTYFLICASMARTIPGHG